MSQVKDDLICQIIRISQTNLLEKIGKANACPSDEFNQRVVDWIKNNAAEYRKCFKGKLGTCSTSELSHILRKVSQTTDDLDKILANDSNISDSGNNYQFKEKKLA
ncbi:MAG: hypothetical protein ACE5EK_09285 [Nitrospinales bacterium]